MRGILKRIYNLEQRMQAALRTVFYSDDDGFVAALVGDERREKEFKTENGYDLLKALDATAAEDWTEEDLKGYSNNNDETEEIYNDYCCGLYKQD